MDDGSAKKAMNAAKRRAALIRKSRKDLNLAIDAVFDAAAMRETRKVVDLVQVLQTAKRRADEDKLPVFWEKDVEVGSGSKKAAMQWMPLLYAVFKMFVLRKTHTGAVFGMYSLRKLLSYTSPDFFESADWLAVFMVFTVGNGQVTEAVAQYVPATYLAKTSPVSRHSAHLSYLDLLIRQLGYHTYTDTKRDGTVDSSTAREVVYAEPGSPYRTVVEEAVKKIITREPASIAAPINTAYFNHHSTRLYDLMYALTATHTRVPSMPDPHMLFLMGDHLDKKEVFNSAKTAAWLRELTAIAVAHRNRAISDVRSGGNIEFIPRVKSGARGEPTLLMLAIGFKNPGLVNDVMQLVTSEDREAPGANGVSVDQVLETGAGMSEIAAILAAIGKFRAKAAVTVE